MFWHRLDETRATRIVPELSPKHLDALRQGFVSDRYAAPDFIQEAVLGDELAAIANQERERVEIPAVDLDRRVACAQPPLQRIEHEPFECEARRHVSAKLHDLLMPNAAQWLRRPAAVMHAGSIMASEANGPQWDGERRPLRPDRAFCARFLAETADGESCYDAFPVEPLRRA